MIPPGRPPVVTAADGNYTAYLAALLISLERNAGASLRDVIVFYKDVSGDERASLAGLLSAPRRVRWVKVSEELCVQVGAPSAIARAPTNYFRLLTPYVCEGERALYLDGDVTVVGDIAELLNAPLYERSVAAVVDWLATTKDAIQNWRELGLDGDAPYFNSGVLLLDLERWRDRQLSVRALETCVANQQFLLAQGRWAQHEQYGLNVALAGDWLHLDRRWNYFSELPPGDEEPRIIHFVGQGKPISPRCQSVFSAAFFAMLSNTPWDAALKAQSSEGL